MFVLILCGVSWGAADAGGAAQSSETPLQEPLERSGDRGPSTYMVKLSGQPAARVISARRRNGDSPQAARRAGRVQVARIEDEQDVLIEDLERRDLIEGEVFRVASAYNGVAVLTTPAEAQRITHLDGVDEVVELAEHELQSSYSVPGIGASEAWSAPPAGITAEGIRIGIIDSGVDYTHLAFGGSGDRSDYDLASAPANNPEAATDDPGSFTVSNGTEQLYPNSKVVGGFDFAGDDYNSADPERRIPRPDPNPLDCDHGRAGGHGTAVAGTAAAYGVDGGVAIEGDYGSVDPMDLDSGPGMAPGAEIYALRVFGCEGSTRLLMAAIDWAADPNRDGDTSDRLDVVNISLGAAFGFPGSPEGEALDALSLAGVAIVNSAGNDGNWISEVNNMSGSARALSVANFSTGTWSGYFGLSGSYTMGTTISLSGSYSSRYPWAYLPTNTVEAPLTYLPSNPYGCTEFSGAEAAQVTGRVVLLDWVGFGAPGCPPATSAANAHAAGAVGVILGDQYNTSVTFIPDGTTEIPVVYTGDGQTETLKEALESAGDQMISLHVDQRFREHHTYSEDVVVSDSSRGPAANLLKPDLAAPGYRIRSPRVGSGHREHLTTGTSLAAPHATGAMALITAARPGWSVEERKALLMNTARPDLYSGDGHTGPIHYPQRVGAGRIDVAQALTSEAVAMEASGSGAVSVSFGPLEVPVGAPFTADRRIKLVNHGSVSRIYNASFDSRSAVPGLDWDFPDGSAITVGPGDEAEFRVRLRIDDPDQLRNEPDPTLPTTQGTVALKWMAEAAGLVRLSTSGQPTLSVPVHASLRPASSITSGRASMRLPDQPVTSGEIELSGATVDTGATPTDFKATMRPFELLASSPQLDRDLPAVWRAADVRYVGVAVDDTHITVGLNFWAKNPIPDVYTWTDVLIDVDRDGREDFRALSARIYDSSLERGLPAFGTWLQRRTEDEGGGETWASAGFTWNPISALVPEGGAFNSDLHEMPFPLSALDLEGDSRIDLTIVTGRTGGQLERIGPLTWDPQNPGLSFEPGGELPDIPRQLGFTYDADRVALHGGPGDALIFHRLNQTGERAEVIEMEVEQPPVAHPGGPYSLKEGETLQLDGSGSHDPNGDDLAISWDLDGDGSFELLGPRASLRVDDGPRTLSAKIRVSDGNTQPVEQGFQVKVANVAPKLFAQVKNGVVEASAQDPSRADTAAGFTYRFQVAGESAVREQRGTTARLSLPGARVVREVRVTATDKDGGASAAASIGLAATRAKRCRVPRLKGRTLRNARRAARKSGCRLGRVRRLKSKKVRGSRRARKLRPVVVRQAPRPRAQRARGAKIRVWVRPRPVSRRG